MHRVDAVGNSLGVYRELTEGIGSLLGWCKGVRQKKTETRRKIIGVVKKLVRKDQMTHRKNVEGCRIGGTVDPPKASGETAHTQVFG
ncbi:hypothetical protein B296_00041029 [Ensete ventricosum]|uniref:Uncharacterized protein n=1 Tax=Ensete ventricosum TaxID=4639 RepID=A0A426XTV6_ENSVE|nr:hypothetical protein B296_00041029 [Ensete ventricosum]